MRNVDLPVPGRVLGSPPLASGPLEDVTIDNDSLVRDYCIAMGWDPETGIPTEETVRRLGLAFALDGVGE